MYTANICQQFDFLYGASMKIYYLQQFLELLLRKCITDCNTSLKAFIEIWTYSAEDPVTQILIVPVHSLEMCTVFKSALKFFDRDAFCQKALFQANIVNMSVNKQFFSFRINLLGFCPSMSCSPIQKMFHSVRSIIPQSVSKILKFPAFDLFIFSVYFLLARMVTRC